MTPTTLERKPEAWNAQRQAQRAGGETCSMLASLGNLEMHLTASGDRDTACPNGNSGESLDSLWQDLAKVDG